VNGKDSGLALIYQSLHRSKDADAVLARLEARSPGEDWPMGIARVYAYRGRKDEAFKWLERTYLEKDVDLWPMKGNPLLTNLEVDPRYKVFLRKMNLPD
jgi:hypothetical protein